MSKLKTQIKSKVQSSKFKLNIGGIWILGFGFLISGIAYSQTMKKEQEPKDTTQPQVNKARTYYSFGYEHLKNEMYDDAIRNFELAIQDSATYIEAYIRLSLAYKGKNMYDKMEETYKRLEKIAPDKSYYALGSLFTETGNFDSAVVEYQKTIALDSNCVGAWYGLGYAYEQKKDTLNAIQCYEQALKIDSTNESVRYALGKIYISQGKSDEGIKELKDLSVAHPEDLDIRKRLGKALLSAKKYSEAIIELEYIAKQLPSDIGNKVNLATGYEGAKLYEQAIQTYKEIIAIDTTNIFSYFPLINLHIQLKNLTEALRLIKQSKSIAPDNQVLHCLTGDIQLEFGDGAFKKKKYESAISSYKAALNEYKMAFKGESPEWREYSKKSIDRTEIKIEDAGIRLEEQKEE